MSGDIHLSIIIPVYNVEQYLPECLESIVGQLNSRTELICIDDGSTDSSAAICDEYSQRCGFVLAVHQKNAGVSAARNYGLKLARGRYVAFIDSDDFVSDDYIETILGNIDTHDLLVFDSDKFLSGQTAESCGFSFLMPGRNEISAVYKEVEICHFFQCWDKVYRREFLQTHGITFPEGHLFGEDMQFVLNYIDCVQDVFYVNQPLYHYRLRENSGSQNTSLVYLNNHIENYTCLRTFLEEHASGDYSSINQTTFHIVCQCIERLSGDELRELRKERLLTRDFIEKITDFTQERSIEKLRVFLLKHQLFQALHDLRKLKGLGEVRMKK